jgi:hypothetical protein
LLAFWFAVDKENFELAQKLMNWDLSIRYIATLAIRGYKERPKKFKVKKWNKILGMKRFTNFKESQIQQADLVNQVFDSGTGEPL